jgi:hypothetical protein
MDSEAEDEMALVRWTARRRERSMSMKISVEWRLFG